MGNTLGMDKKDLIERLFATGWSNRKINRSTGIHRDTVSAYRKKWQQELTALEADRSAQSSSDSTTNKTENLSQSVPPTGGSKCPPSKVAHFEVPTDPDEADKKPSKSKVAVYDSEIKEKLKAGQNAQSIYQDLCAEEAYRGSYYSVKRYVRKLNKKDPKLYARIETLPGVEAQVDFGQGAPTNKNGRYVKPWLFVMTLSNSRKSFEKVVWHQDVETFIRCHEEAFLAFGGVTATLLLDNLKSGVLKAHLYEPELNPLYEAYSKHAGFIPLPCRVATPQHKGKVESNVDYVQDNALGGKRFESIDEQNTHLQNWNNTWASTRIHGTTKRQVNAMFKKEQPALQALPEKSFAYFKVGNRKVNALDSHIEVGGAFYPIPPKYMGKQVNVHFNSEWVKVLYHGEVIQWLDVTRKGSFHADRSCLPENKSMDQNTWQKRLLQQCDAAGSGIRRWADQAISSRGIIAYRAVNGVLQLKRKYPVRDLNKACNLACERGSFTYHLIRNYLEEGIMKQEEQQLEIRLQQSSDIIRSPKEYAHIIGELGEVQS
ncbi:MAG: IS21 family transposase [Candidatus Marinimicrobia bacterium]|nr:IS21 family transposase [Candidatus Neomarinimicrobiota bacterium]